MTCGLKYKECDKFYKFVVSFWSTFRQCFSHIFGVFTTFKVQTFTNGSKGKWRHETYVCLQVLYQLISVKIWFCGLKKLSHLVLWLKVNKANVNFGWNLKINNAYQQSVTTLGFMIIGYWITYHYLLFLLSLLCCVSQISLAWSWIPSVETFFCWQFRAGVF